MKPSIHYIEELAAQWEPRLHDSFLAAIQDIRSRVNITALAKMLERGDVEGALRIVGLDPADFSQLALDQARVFHEGGMATAGRIPTLRQPEGHRLEVRFDVRNPAAEQWVRDRSSALVGEIVEDQRIAVRQALYAGLTRGETPRTTALNLVGRVAPSGERQGGVIGLHSTQEAWLESYVADLASSEPDALRRLLARGLRDRRFDRSVLKAINEGAGLPAELQAKMRTSYANRALKWRADNIARTETMRALGAAQTNAWEQAIDKGRVDVSTITRFWVTAHDERVRATHRMIPGMNKDGVRWNEAFATPTGPSMHAPHDRDPQCRCRERIDVDFLASAVRRLRAA